MKNSIKIAIELVGGVKNLARLIGASHQAVYAWAGGSKLISAEYCPNIEKVTAGKVRCEDLRPDVSWSVLRGTEAQQDE